MALPFAGAVAGLGSVLGQLAGKALFGAPEPNAFQKAGGIGFSSNLTGLSRQDLERLLADLTKGEEISRNDIINGTDQATQILQSVEAMVQERSSVPYNANNAAITQLLNLSGLTGEDPQSIMERLQNTPGYQFRFNEGRRAVERSGASRGLLESGAMLKDLTNFGQGLASQEFGAEQQRLLGLANATSNQALAGQSALQALGTGRAELQANQGTSLANISQAAAQARASGLQSGGTKFNQSISIPDISGLERKDWEAIQYDIPGIANFFPGNNGSDGYPKGFSSVTKP